MRLRESADRGIVETVAAAVPPVGISAVGAGLNEACRIPGRRRRVSDTVGPDENVDLIDRRRAQYRRGTEQEDADA